MKPNPALTGFVRLLVYTPVAPAPSTYGTRIGGLPIAPPETAWPMCSECEDPMVFLAQVRLEDAELGSGIFLAFLCETGKTPRCLDRENWDGNRKAMIVGAVGNFIAVQPPDGSCVRLPRGLGVETIPLGELTDYDRVTYIDAVRDRDDVAGKLGGRGVWLSTYGDEWGDPLVKATINTAEGPFCPCQLADGKPKQDAPGLRLVAQLELHGIVAPQIINNGCAYLLLCPLCKEPMLLVDVR